MAGHGSSYLPSDINAAYLFAQLEGAEGINNNRLTTWNIYYDELRSLQEKGNIELPYIPLHSSPAGKKFGEFVGEDKYTTKESERLVRLPLYYGIEEKDLNYIIEKINKFFI